MKNIAIFASGSGSNTETIARYFSDNSKINVGLILTNNPKAGVIDRAKRLQIPYVIFNREVFYKSDQVLKLLVDHNIDLVVLAGFLWLVPKNIILAFPDKIINIHPALLPKYGGKGMFGHHVHESVIAAGEKTSGITIHFVNEKYDDGQIILRKEVEIEESDDAESLASKIHLLEHENFPKVIESLLV